MVNTMKQVTVTTLTHEWKTRRNSDEKITLDLVEETQDLLVKIVFACLFGNQHEKLEVQHIIDGQHVMMPLCKSMLKTF